MRGHLVRLSSLRSSFCLGLGVVVLGCGTATSVCGCWDDPCADSFTCPSGPEAPVCNPDPALGPTDCSGVFVSASLGKDTNPGTRDEPVQTFERAISLAAAGPKHVYACAERFAEAVRLPSGVSVWGGLDCAHGWTWLGGDNRTVVAPDADLVPLRVDPGEGLSSVADLRLEAADAVQPSGSSIAMIVLGGAAVEVLRGELFAGNGADGANGAGLLDPAMGGAPGNPGAAACSADTVAGAPAVSTVCDDVISVGGNGGDGGVTSGSAGNDGQPAPFPNPDGWGLGGSGANAGVQCNNGELGLNGADGEHGLGARRDGAHITPEGGWAGKRGKDGVDGRPGQGGGGGGGSRGGLVFCGAGSKGGASGGSGGAGGCGGLGGKGGGFGGASIGLISFSGDVSLQATSIVTSKGGDGGTGGLGQFGGAQGAPGLGGGSVGGSPPGCEGGRGGKGGNGGYGGGGLGGPSIGIAHFNGQLPATHDVPITIGSPGKGGLGGNEYVPGSAGEDGIEADTLGFPR